ncbi:hypothetical protein LZ32DRAFT_623048 [Colletotrichum eremochloae]|nr:hypothetical protein LZ32DRAFT_623048 [Colletotrichum eremochloae]
MSGLIRAVDALELLHLNFHRLSLPASSRWHWSPLTSDDPGAGRSGLLATTPIALVERSVRSSQALPVLSAGAANITYVVSGLRIKPSGAQVELLQYDVHKALEHDAGESGGFVVFGVDIGLNVFALVPSINVFFEASLRKITVERVESQEYRSQIMVSRWLPKQQVKGRPA